MSFDYSKLRGKIIEKYGSQTAFAKEFGISENVFSKKMNNKVRFNTDDMMKIKNMLDIPDSEINLYFFTLLV
mgnify:CR=1 FL=1